MANTTATQSLPSQLDREMSELYRHFLTGDLNPLEFSELLDDLIGVHTLIENADATRLCQA
jgi:hypothetical protein